MTAREPRRGDMVLFRGRVTAEPDDDGDLRVVVSNPTGSTVYAVKADEIFEVLGPPWFPPVDQDVVLDGDGHPWQYYAVTDRWVMAGYSANLLTEDLHRRHSPLTLVSRDGKPMTQ